MMFLPSAVLNSPLMCPLWLFVQSSVSSFLVQACASSNRGGSKPQKVVLDVCLRFLLSFHLSAALGVPFFFFFPGVGSHFLAAVEAFFFSLFSMLFTAAEEQKKKVSDAEGSEDPPPGGLVSRKHHFGEFLACWSDPRFICLCHMLLAGWNFG